MDTNSILKRWDHLELMGKMIVDEVAALRKSLLITEKKNPKKGKGLDPLTKEQILKRRHKVMYRNDKKD